MTQSLVMQDSESRALAMQQADMLAKSNLVPKEYAKNPANCLIAVDMAAQMGANPMMVMQNSQVIHGKLGLASTFIIACVNSSGRFSPLQYIFGGSGDDYGCKASAIDRETGERIDGPTVTMGMAKAEGWYGKNGSKWKTMPELMLRYRAAAFFARTTCPEIMMGMQSDDELRDIAPRDITPTDRPPVGIEAAKQVMSHNTQQSQETVAKNATIQGSQSTSEPAYTDERSTDFNILVDNIEAAQDMKDLSGLAEACAALNDTEQDEIRLLWKIRRDELNPQK
jgi:hypothetical protein